MCFQSIVDVMYDISLKLSRHPILQTICGAPFCEEVVAFFTWPWFHVCSLAAPGNRSAITWSHPSWPAWRKKTAWIREGPRFQPVCMFGSMFEQTMLVFGAEAVRGKNTLHTVAIHCYSCYLNFGDSLLFEFQRLKIYKNIVYTCLCIIYKHIRICISELIACRLWGCQFFRTWMLENARNAGMFIPGVEKGGFFPARYDESRPQKDRTVNVADGDSLCNLFGHYKYILFI